MSNYWLSGLGHQLNMVKSIHESKYSSSEQSPEDDMEDPEEDPEDNGEEDPEEGPEADLNDRQKMLYEHYEHVVEQFGKFDQTAKANGAHYAPAALNPFKEEGMICGNCVYFIGGGYCEIVSGKIESNAICKLWIIPENLIKAPKKK